MKSQFLLSGTLGLLCLAVLSCSQKTDSGDPFADAKWIGTSERVLYADFWLWEPAERPLLPEGYFWVPESDIDRYGVPRLIEILLDALHKHTASATKTQTPD